MNLIDLLKRIKIGTISDKVQKHFAMWFELNEFKMLINFTSTPYISVSELGKTFECYSSDKISDVRYFGVPYIISNKSDKFIIDENPKISRSVFSSLYEMDDERFSLAFRLKLIQGYIETINSEKMQSVILLYDPELFSNPIASMNFREGLFSPLKNIAKELSENYKYFDNEEFEKLLKSLYDHELILKDIDNYNSLLNKIDVESFMKETGYGDEMWKIIKIDESYH